MTQNNDSNTQRTKKLLVSACDFIMLNACFIAVWFGFAFNKASFLTMLCINAVAIIALRQWLCHYIQIPWLYSPFNRFLKRGTDILLATTFLLSIFPLILILQTISIKKRRGGAVLHFCRIGRENGNSFKALEFGENYFSDIWHLGLSPLALNILWGNISMWDLRSISRIENPSEEKTETCSSINDVFSPNGADEPDSTEENCETTDNDGAALVETSNDTTLSEKQFIENEHI